MTTGFDSMQVRRVDMYPAGDRIVSLIHTAGSGEGTRGEMEVEFRTAHVTTFADGKVVDWQVFDNARAAFEAAGARSRRAGRAVPRSRLAAAARRPRRRPAAARAPAASPRRPASRTSSSPLASAAAKAAASPASTAAFAMWAARRRSGSSIASRVAAPRAMSRPPAILATATVAAEWSLNPSAVEREPGRQGQPDADRDPPRARGEGDGADVGRACGG